ncbi:kelch-like protein 35 [Oncorhynchus nerka]|uniref:kelch-like protein 35 n=1 Tax=Oncorhynchus nerka TaxID=8023 RepID=UPI0031B81AC2
MPHFLIFLASGKLSCFGSKTTSHADNQDINQGGLWEAGVHIRLVIVYVLNVILWSIQVQCYNTEEDQWQYVSSCPFSQRCINATTHNNTIYVVGGLLDQIYSYTPKTDNWSKVVDLPMKLESCGLTVCEGKVYIVGGRDSCASATDQVWAYSPESGKLTDEKPMSRSVSYHGCVTVTQWPPKKTH